jgi:hypothetical protein
MFSRNANKVNMYCAVCCKGRAGDILRGTSVAQQHHVLPRGLLWMRLQQRITFSQLPFFPMKILSVLLYKCLCGFCSYSQPYGALLLCIACNSLLLYNHALSNTNIVCLNFDRRERSRSSQWVRAVRMWIDCWQERRFCVFARAVYRLRLFNGAYRPEGEDTKLHLMLWCRMFRAVSYFPFVPTVWCH